MIKESDDLKLLQKRLFGLSEITLCNYLYLILRAKAFKVFPNDTFSNDVLQLIYADEIECQLKGSLFVSNATEVFKKIEELFVWRTYGSVGLKECYMNLYKEFIEDFFNEPIEKYYIYEDTDGGILDNFGIINFVVILHSKTKGIVLEGIGFS